MIDNDTSTMSYVLKDHLGSMYATVTNGSVDYYSFDAWGRERNPNTFLYDNAYIDTYDFNSGGSMMRNIATRVAKIIVGNGTPFKIYGWGDNPKIHAPW